MTMTSTDLKQQIESYWLRLKEQSAFYHMIQAGTITGKELGLLLAGTKYLITHTPTFLDAAIYKAEEVKERVPELASYFRQSRATEVDHDQWATADLENLREIRSGVVEDVAPAMRDLVSFIGETIERDPVLLIAYILWAEYLVVVSADEMASLLQERCDIPPDVLTVFLRHAELDRDHSDDDTAILDDLLVREPAYGQKFVDVISQASDIYLRFWNEIA